MIAKWTETNNITYEVDNVRKSNVQDNIVTKFFILDFIRGMKDSTKKYWVTVFDDINLENGDRIKIMDFDCLVTSQNPKTKKIMQFISAEVIVIKKADFHEEVPELENPYEE